MSEFLDMQDLLPDFLAEAREMLEDVDQKLVELEHNAKDKGLLNTIFRGFHTIKGGAGFLDAGAMVELCHRTENLFDHLRSDKLSLTPEMLDVILAATGSRQGGRNQRARLGCFSSRGIRCGHERRRRLGEGSGGVTGGAHGHCTSCAGGG